ncbi:MAG: lipoprotein [Alkalimonas sp.]|uniref:Lipoprotein n=1 Tax=Alkalimonas delamerensis TaxID=265981 RepID=A0ABT9GTE3_9GAMM|nr:lipoprotein [Alkalimonas delamerensis]MCC5852023.1 lipoprotein [Alkalimonas sp.]MDP4530237.1 lipoprotein [Alkalimonas delamerensis]
MKYIIMHPAYRTRLLVSRFALVAVALLAFTACGQKGPLTLPQPPETVAEEPSDPPEKTNNFVSQSEPYGPF